MKPLETVNILADGPDCWILPWAGRLREELRQRGFRACLATAEQELQPADVCFLLGCTRLLPESLLAMHRHNIVVHESRLPRGRGFAPLSWQVLEGASEIPVSLFEATSEADSGPVYLEDTILLRGTELMPELRALQGEMTLGLCLRFMDAGGALVGRPQNGEPSQYPRRTRAHDELDPRQTLADLFDRLRVADNERYPAWFSLRGERYILRIEHMPEDDPANSHGSS